MPVSTAPRPAPSVGAGSGPGSTPRARPAVSGLVRRGNRSVRNSPVRPAARSPVLLAGAGLQARHASTPHRCPALAIQAIPRSDRGRTSRCCHRGPPPAKSRHGQPARHRPLPPAKPPARRARAVHRR
ncbi:hypothetical protein G6F24_016749 [Rhizopus arrhizus]|nr:hypothetical protein G6F24_016749 [Rhizopus arrhizus]